MSPSLQSGKCNSGIAIVEVSGKKFVKRLYDKDIVDAASMRWQLDVAFEAGLVQSADWILEDAPCGGTWVSNPWQRIVGLDSVSQEVLWKAYEDFLKRVKALWRTHGAVVSDAHSKNIVLCAEDDGSVRLYIVDGKVAGIQTDPSLRRLSVKYKCEDVLEHRWFLWEYWAFLKKTGAR